jgi:hypothetical protein
MITRLILDTEHAPAGTPVAFVDWEISLDGVEMVSVQLPGGELVEVPAAAIEAGHEPEESLSRLAQLTGIKYDTLARYAREGRILARRSAGVWLSTVTAVKHAKISPRS